MKKWLLRMGVMLWLLCSAFTLVLSFENRRLPGPQGPLGKQGLQGPQGMQGKKGDTGATGPPGLQDVSQNIFINSIQETVGSVVQIKNLIKGLQGSGIAWTEDIIVTARHVVEGSNDFEITLNDGMKLKAIRAISSKKYDVGFIKLGEKVLKPAKFGSVKETLLGQSLYVIGSPYGKVNFNSVTLGIVSGLDRNQDDIDPDTGKPYGWEVAFTTDSAGHPGNSGCPVFTMDGVVRGILVGGYSPVLIICMPVDLFINDLEAIQMMFEQQRFHYERRVYYDNGMLMNYTSKGNSK